jgi:hypothetical protein
VPNRRALVVPYLKKKLAFEVFISGVVLFDAVGCYAYRLPTLQFLPMWAGAMVEIEAGARTFSWLSKRIHFRPVKPLPA